MLLARVCLFGHFGCFAELLDDPVAWVFFDDSLQFGEEVTGFDDEVLGDGANLFVLFACEGDAFGAELVGALAEKQHRLVGGTPAGCFSDCLVDIAEERLVGG